MRVFLDACVLYPPLVRALLLGAARAGLFQPLWSERVLDEWLIAAVRKGAAAEAEIMAERALMAERFPEATVAAPPETPRPLLPDPADSHVLQAAIAGGAASLLTFNLRDFPQRTLRAYNLAPLSPDSLLWNLLSGPEGAPLSEVIRRALPDAKSEDIRRALKRARLPRTAKCWAANHSA